MAEDKMLFLSPLKKKVLDFTQDLYWKRRKVTVYALSGKSGTGKSFRSKLLAEKHKIDLIIDDGLLIGGNEIVGGSSAKAENQYIGAIRRALFDDEAHRNEMIETLRKSNFHKILLLGTSRKMVEKIAERLKLPNISEFMTIESISTPEEIKKALASRERGEHVIPVPMLEVSRTSPNILSTFVHLVSRQFGKKTTWEKAIVNPPFQHGKGGDHISVSQEALVQMMSHCLDELESGTSVERYRIRTAWNGKYRIQIYITGPSYNIDYGDLCYRAHDYIISHIRRYTGIEIEKLDISLAKIAGSAPPSTD